MREQAMEPRLSIFLGANKEEIVIPVQSFEMNSLLTALRAPFVPPQTLH